MASPLLDALCAGAAAGAALGPAEPARSGCWRAARGSTPLPSGAAAVPAMATYEKKTSDCADGYCLMAIG